METTLFKIWNKYIYTKFVDMDILKTYLAIVCPGSKIAIRLLLFSE